LSDSIADVENQDQEFLGSKSKEFKVREVILHGDDTPIVFARTIIPVLTIEDGLDELGRLGSKPLGDILFERKIFQKKDSVYASFEYKQNSFWGRKIKYLVNEQPFSVMEIFLFKNEI
jgi:chorismate--pyruvate lyase